MKLSPYWLDTLDPSDSSCLTAEVRPLPDSVDVAVVGGGYTGLAAARRLAMNGASVAVLEREHVGAGASSRNGGQVLTGLKIDGAALVASYGESKARALFETAAHAIDTLESVLDEEQISCEYERTGHLQAACTPAHFAGFREEQDVLARVFHHRVELVPPAEQHAEIGSRAYHGVLVDPASRGINPARYVAGLCAAARRRGACVAAQTPVTALARRGSGWIMVTPRGEIAANDVLVATNGYTGPATPALQRRFIPVGSYIVVTEPLSASDASAVLPKRRMAFDSRHFLFYFRLTPDNRLLFGGRAEFSPSSPASTRRAGEILRRGLAHVFPRLAGRSIDYVWSGNVAFTRDQLPRAGRLDGLYFAGGYGGHGIAMATYLGDTIARRMSGEAVSDPLLDDEMPPIPLYTGRPWFLPMVGAYYKVVDWLQ